MIKLLSLTLLSLPLSLAAPAAEPGPQGIGVVICDQTAVTEWQYKNSQPPQDVTNTFGDNGWENYDGNVCTSNSESCARQAGTAVTRTLSISFKLGGDINIAKAGKTGLDFGVQVATANTKSEATVERCPGTKDDTKECVCGLQSKAFRQRAVGTKTATNACGKKISGEYDITAPVVKDGPDNPWVQWRACRSSQSTCDEMKSRPACANGL